MIELAGQIFDCKDEDLCVFGVFACFGQFIIHIVHLRFGEYRYGAEFEQLLAYALHIIAVDDADVVKLPDPQECAKLRSERRSRLAVFLLFFTVNSKYHILLPIIIVKCRQASCRQSSFSAFRARFPISCL